MDINTIKLWASIKALFTSLITAFWGLIYFFFISNKNYSILSLNKWKKHTLKSIEKIKNSPLDQEIQNECIHQLTKKFYKKETGFNYDTLNPKNLTYLREKDPFLFSDSLLVRYQSYFKASKDAVTVNYRKSERVSERILSILLLFCSFTLCTWYILFVRTPDSISVIKFIVLFLVIPFVLVTLLIMGGLINQKIRTLQEWKKVLNRDS